MLLECINTYLLSCPKYILARPNSEALENLYDFLKNKKTYIHHVIAKYYFSKGISLFICVINGLSFRQNHINISFTDIDFSAVQTSVLIHCLY